MARPNELVPGNCYFTVMFHDRKLLFPYISTLKFLRSEMDEENRRIWLFEVPNDPQQDEKGASTEPLLSLTDEQLSQVSDFSGLIERLREVAVDHPLTPIQPRHMAFATSLPSDLQEKVKEFLYNSHYLALTIALLFTDEGLSLGRRREGGYEITFTPHPRRESDKEARIRALFSNRGMTPHKDYLADRGRTRILTYPAPNYLEELEKLCGDILLGVYAMRTDDRLKYSFLRASDVT